jgi:nucleoside-diphosphate-sugar epimerase
MHKAFVTGGNGYIGSVLIKRLLRTGIEVHALANRNRGQLDTMLAPENIHALGNDYAGIEAMIARVQPEVIFHLAGIHVEPTDMVSTAEMIACNLTTGTALLRGAALCSQPPLLVNSGSYWQFSEEASYSPNTFYAATKQAFMDLMRFYEKFRGIRSTSLILFDTFGFDDPRPKLWTKILHAPHGARIPLSEGRQFIELVHVDDVVEAFMHAAELMEPGTELGAAYAVRSERTITLRELIESFNAHAGTNLHLDWGAIAYWEGQIFQPWQGPLLPGWHAKIRIDTTVAEYLRERNLSPAEVD